VALPNNTRLSGRLYVKEGRVYGRFTEARTPLGVTYPVCLDVMDTDGNVGLALLPGSAPGKMLVDPVVRVRVVDRFK
jgi:serine/threonine-protein kinase